VVVAVKLKYHRLKPGGVQSLCGQVVAVKLRYHWLKPVVLQAHPTVNSISSALSDNFRSSEL